MMCQKSGTNHCLSIIEESLKQLEEASMLQDNSGSIPLESTA